MLSLPLANNKTIGINKSLLYNGSRFAGSQKSKGNSYDVEVVLQVSSKIFYKQTTTKTILLILLSFFFSIS